MGSLRLPEHWSHSTLGLYETCPAAAAAKFSGEPALAGPHVTEGKDLHEAIARYAEHCWQDGRKVDGEAADSIAAAYPDAVAAGLRSFAETMRWPWGKPEGPCPVEQAWEITLPNGAKFRGRTDLVYTEAGALAGNPFADGPDRTTVVDWKLHRWGDWFGADVPGQLLTYAYAHQQTHPEAREFSLFLGAPGWSGKWAMRRWDWGGPLRVMVGGKPVPVGDWLAARVDRIMADTTWEARPGPTTCPRCFYAASCPLRDTQAMHVLTDTPTANLAQAVAWHKAQGTLASGIIKGRTEAGEETGWGWKPKTSLRPVDEVSLREVCAAASRDYRELLGGWDKRKVAKAVKDGWLPEDLFETVDAGRAFGPLTSEGGDE